MWTMEPLVCTDDLFCYLNAKIIIISADLTVKILLF